MLCKALKIQFQYYFYQKNRFLEEVTPVRRKGGKCHLALEPMSILASSALTGGFRAADSGSEGGRAGAGQWALTPGPSRMGLFSGQTVEVGPFPTMHTLKKSFR